MFCYDKVGAQASANLYPLVMTARANGMEPFECLNHLFEHLPTATTVEEIEAFRAARGLTMALRRQCQSEERYCLAGPDTMPLRSLLPHSWS
jgi:hypothetical protein